MKKILKWGFSLLLVFAMLFALAGCSPEGEVNDVEDVEDEVSEEEVVEEETEEVVEEEEEEVVEEEEEEEEE